MGEDHRLVWASFARTGLPMGMQHYEHHLMMSLNALNTHWTFTHRPVTSLRSHGRGVHLPLRSLERGPAWWARAAGRVAYGNSAHVHRLDLRLPPAHGPEVVTVHDLPPLRFPDEGHLPEWSVSTSRRARAVIVPSQFAANEVSELLGVNNIVVIPNGVDAAFRDAQALDASAWEAMGLPERFVLHAAGATQRKNLQGLSDAWRLLAPNEPDVGLVLVGPGDPRREAAFSGLDRVRILDYLPPERVARLMASAELVVVPSAYEGFGLPALEAMAVGTPVVASDRGALPEVCSDAAVLVPPTPEGLARGLRSALNDGDLRSACVIRGKERAAIFSWEASARGHLACYDTYLM